MPEYLWTARLEAAATARNVSLTSPQTLAGDGSDRRYYRLLGSPTVVLLFHPFPPGGEVNENDSYYLVGRHLRAQGVPVPEIYTYCREEFWMMIEDLGDISLECRHQAAAPGEPDSPLVPPGPGNPAGHADQGQGGF